MATQKYQVLENRMISHAGVNYIPGNIVELTPEKAKLHLDGKNITPYEEKAAIAASPAKEIKETKAPVK